MAETIKKQCGCVIERTLIGGKGKVQAFADNILNECEACKASKVVDENKRVAEEAISKLKAYDQEHGPRYLRDIVLKKFAADIDPEALKKLQAAEANAQVLRSTLRTFNRG